MKRAKLIIFILVIAFSFALGGCVEYKAPASLSSNSGYSSSVEEPSSSEQQSSVSSENSSSKVESSSNSSSSSSKVESSSNSSSSSSKVESSSNSSSKVESSSNSSSSSSKVESSSNSSSSSSKVESSSNSSSSSSKVESSSSSSNSSSSDDSGQVETYQLTINYVGAPSTIPSHTQTLKYGESYKVLSPEVSAYIADKQVVSGTMGAQDTTITVTYRAVSYNINYEYNGGKAGATNPTSIAYNNAFCVSSPTRAGYKFAGWQIANVNTATALYGNATEQVHKVFSDLTYCYQLNTSDTDYNGSAYWTGDVYFKNLTTTNGATVTLRANWTCLDRIMGANDAASVINTANKGLGESKEIEIGNALKGTFILSFTYYQNACVDSDNLAFKDNCWRTGILGIAKYTDWGYYSHIRQDGFSWQGTNPIGKISSNSYNGDSTYGDMFYGLAGNNNGGIESTKFATFVRNSLVSYTIEGIRVGLAGGKLKITQTITSLSQEYKNQEVSIVYDVDLTEGAFYNTGLDFIVKAEDADLSFISVYYEIISEDVTHNSTGKGAQDLLSSTAHFAPDIYWSGDFNFLMSYNYSQIGYVNSGEVVNRHPVVSIYQWGNPQNRFWFRNDWYAGAEGSGFSYTHTVYQNVSGLNSIGTANVGCFTTFGGSVDQERRLMRNASVTVHCSRVGNTITIYQYISYPGSSEVTWYNVYKVQSSLDVSIQVVAPECGLTATYEDFGANVKGPEFTTYNYGTYSFAPNNTRAHVASRVPVKAGTVIKFKGNLNQYCWSVLELKEYLGANPGYDSATASAYHILDTTWMGYNTDGSQTAAGAKTSYVVQNDCYIAINLRNRDNSQMANYSSSQIYELFKLSFEIIFDFNGAKNITTFERPFTTSMLQSDAIVGLNTFSGQFGESDARCHMAIIPLLKAGTVITYTGSGDYFWSVLEMSSERGVLFDTTWQDGASVKTYTLTRDCYIAINVRHVNNYDYHFTGVDLWRNVFNNFKVEGKCGFVVCEDPITNSTTEEGDMASVSHRGFSSQAPENTLAAYSMSKYKGYTKVEVDINFTKDGHAVLIHDTKIDRTSNGTGKIRELYFADVRKFDFNNVREGDENNIGGLKTFTDNGVLKYISNEYPHEQMATVEEFLLQCKNLNLHPYLELKYGTKAEIQRLAVLVRRFGMEDNVTWISFDLNCLHYIKEVSPRARLGYLYNAAITQTVINNANALKTGFNEVFMDIYYGWVDTASEATPIVNMFKENNLPLEVWTVNDENTMRVVYNATGGYVTGFTSDNIIAEEVFK